MVSPLANGEGSMGDVPTPVSSSGVGAASQPSHLTVEVRKLVETITGERIDPEHDDASFLELGLDSLALTQATLEIERRYGIKLKFRRLLEDLSSVTKLSAWLVETMPAKVAPAITPSGPIAGEHR